MPWHVSPLVYPVLDSVLHGPRCVSFNNIGKFSAIVSSSEMLSLSFSSPWIPIMWMLVYLILSTKCLKLSSIFWLIFFFLVLRLGDLHYSVCLFLFFNINVFNRRLITLQYCSGSAIHWHASTTGAHVLPILRPRPLPLGQPSALALLCVSAYWSVLWII